VSGHALLCTDEIIATPDFNRRRFFWHQILRAEFGGVAVIELHHGYAVKASICVQISKCVSFGHMRCSFAHLGEHGHRFKSVARSLNRQRPPVLPAIRKTYQSAEFGAEQNSTALSLFDV